MGHCRRQMFDICKMHSRWAAVKSPADSSEVQSSLLIQRKCWFLTDSPSKGWRAFICISYMGQAWGLNIFWKTSALIYSEFSEKFNNLENWVMCVSVVSLKIIFFPWFDLQLPAAVSGTSVVAMPVLRFWQTWLLCYQQKKPTSAHSLQSCQLFFTVPQCP